MVKLKKSEISLIEDFVAYPKGRGYVLEFSDRSFAEYFEDEFGIDIDIEEYYASGGSKRNRLTTFCQISDAHLVHRVLKQLFEIRSDIAEVSEVKPRDGLERRFLNLLKDLKLDADKPNTDGIDTYSSSRTLEELVKDIGRDIDENKPEAAIDHLHTYCMKKFAYLVKQHGGKVDENDALNARFAKYRKLIVEKFELRPFTDQAMKSSISILSQFNDIRNNHSFAHDNEILVDIEARFVFDTVLAILRLVRSFEAEHFGEC